MSDSVIFKIDRPGYSVKMLDIEEAEQLQILYEQCTDFSILTEGKPFSSTEARDEFSVVPDGKTTADKYILGLFDIQNNLVGIIESIRHYPDDRTWWVGLMMLSPKQRGQKLGYTFYRAFEDWISAQGIKRVSLCAIEANEIGIRFWKSLGFEIIERRKPQKFGLKTHVVYVMSRNIKITDNHSFS